MEGKRGFYQMIELEESSALQVCACSWFLTFFADMFSGGSIGADGATQLARMLEHNKSVTSLVIDPFSKMHRIFLFPFSSSCV